VRATPRHAAKQLIASGAVKRPPVLLVAASARPLLAASPGAPQMDMAALAASAFSAGAAAPSDAHALALRQTPGALAAPPARAGPVYNRAIGVDPAARPAKLSASEAAEASGVALTATAFRDLALPD
jgi:hypothetical protein